MCALSNYLTPGAVCVCVGADTDRCMPGAGHGKPLDRQLRERAVVVLPTLELWPCEHACHAHHGRAAGRGEPLPAPTFTVTPAPPAGRGESLSAPRPHCLSPPSTLTAWPIAGERRGYPLQLRGTHIFTHMHMAGATRPTHAHMYMPEYLSICACRRCTSSYT